MEIDFKFEIGDMVADKGSIAIFEVEWAWKREAIEQGKALPIPILFRVSERHFQQCYNTYQIFYLCRFANPRDANSVEGLRKFTEAELEKFDLLKFVEERCLTEFKPT